MGWRGAMDGRSRLTEDAIEEAVVKRATLCLTTPYDRELVRCVEARRAVAACYRDFESRHGPVFVPPE